MSFAQTKSCLDFHEGSFVIQDSLSGNSYIDREGLIQYEHNYESGLFLKFDVEWLDECTYTLELTEVLQNPNKIDILEDMVLKVEILARTDTSYTQRSTTDAFPDFELVSEVYIHEE